ncbi:MAG: glutamate-ammonia-ligase adenylyltransferase, partial [Spirochaetales bacterium]|nr:glutamate-ammonia-ligase adenylyltransferase [Spirochaetales bacterium]
MEKPTVDILRKENQALSEEYCRDFLNRLPWRYFTERRLEEIHRDAAYLAEVDNGVPFKFHYLVLPDQHIRCTIYAGDFPGIFSLISGLLAASGFNIESGSVCTYARESAEKVSSVRRGHKQRRLVYQFQKPRLIIDRFTGKIAQGRDVKSWEQDLSEKIQKLVPHLPDSTDSSISEARQYVYEEVSRTLSKSSLESSKVLYPMEIDVAPGDSGGTRLRLLSEDTPFFLFSVSNALALYGLTIESVSIRTRGNKIEDDIEITDQNGRGITDPEQINQVKMSVLFTKQFTYFLGTAPDPYAALVRFESISRELALLPADGSWKPLLSDPDFLRDLAKVLGASDFLWEDFIRLQYENILPLLNPNTRSERLSLDADDAERLLSGILSKAKTPNEKKKALNDFKNREIYLIDLDHIVQPDADFLFLSKKLSKLAEVIVNAAIAITEQTMAERFGKPCTFAGLDARYAVMGLGKLGGAALGYASDIELLFIYGDSGSTNGKESIGNSEYYERLFKSAVNLIDAKQEGIFRIDLRLRPYGTAGPTACSLESFCQYYGPDGQSHSYELLALIRMRAIGGDKLLGERIERLRDEMVYRSGSINLKDLRNLREKQLAQKTAVRRLNAKFSPGGLVDLEYSVQIIQCRYGKDNPGLRTPRIHGALEELVRTGYMSGDEAEELVESYQFLRKLINGLRMLRGSARDLFLPELGSDEYAHLARRTGYADTDALRAAQQLHLEFETRTAVVRTFIESHIGRDSIPGPPVGNAADLVLSENLPPELIHKILEEGGIRNYDRALVNITSLRTGTRSLFAGLAVLAWDILRRTPDPDMALNNWERFAGTLSSKHDHFTQLLAEPLQLEILLSIFAGSQFLADTIIRNPDFIAWIAQPGMIHTLRKRSHILEDLRRRSAHSQNTDVWRKELRVLRKREILRIGTRDICLGASFSDVVAEISGLADAIIQSSLERIWEKSARSSSSDSDSFPTLEDSRFAVFAFGKLGGRELNYSSDIDLLAVFDAERYKGSEGNPETLLTGVMEQLRADIADHTVDGLAYRVDFRLRPYGRSSLLAHSLKSITAYYQTSAALWEKQALIKLRPVAGDLEFGEQVLKALSGFLIENRDSLEVSNTVRRLRTAAASRGSSIQSGPDIKSGEGGIRDIEFLVQGLQMIHAGDMPSVLDANTLIGLTNLTD